MYNNGSKYLDDDSFIAMLVSAATGDFASLHHLKTLFGQPNKAEAIRLRLESIVGPMMHHFYTGTDASGQFMQIIAYLLARLAKDPALLSDPKIVLPLVFGSGGVAILSSDAVNKLLQRLKNNKLHAHENYDIRYSDQQPRILNALRPTNQRCVNTATAVASVSILVLWTLANGAFAATASGPEATSILEVLVGVKIADIVVGILRSLGTDGGRFQERMIWLEKLLQTRFAEALKHAGTLGIATGVGVFTMINLSNAGKPNSENFAYAKIVVLIAMFVGAAFAFLARILKKPFPALQTTSELLTFLMRIVYAAINLIMSVYESRVNGLYVTNVYKHFEPAIIVLCLFVILPAIFSFLHCRYAQGITQIYKQFDSQPLWNYIKSCCSCLSITDTPQSHGICIDAARYTIIGILRSFAFLFYTLFWIVMKFMGLDALWATWGWTPQQLKQELYPQLDSAQQSDGHATPQPEVGSNPSVGMPESDFLANVDDTENLASPLLPGQDVFDNSDV